MVKELLFEINPELAAQQIDWVRQLWLGAAIKGGDWPDEVGFLCRKSLERKQTWSARVVSV